jgi:ABC-type antimicrobial peptide transport system permease subunit
MNWTFAFRDLGKQKTRVTFAVCGIAISIFLLTVIGVLGDSVSYAYVNYSTQSAGAMDYTLTGGSINYTYVEQTLSSNTYLNQVIAEYLPRSFADSSRFDQKVIYNPIDREAANVSFIGVNFTAEAQNSISGDQGPFLNNGTGTPFNKTVGVSQIVVTTDLASSLNITVNQSITFSDVQYSNPGYAVTSNWTQSYMVVGIVNLNDKFDSTVDLAAFVDLAVWNNHYSNLSEACNVLVINLKNPKNYYNTENIPGTILKLRQVAERMQNVLGFYNTQFNQNSTGQAPLLSIGMPRASILDEAQFLNIGITIILIVVLILGTVISAVLINGVLTTSVEEKIREYGVFRVLGAHSTLPVKITVVQALMISAVGTTIGFVGGYFAVSQGLLPLVARLLNYAASQIVTVVSAQTIAIALAVGLGVSLLVGISPALRVGRMSILGAINPYRQESVGTRVVKEGSVNGRLVILGGVISLVAGFVLYIVPQILLTLDIGLIIGVIIILLAIFLLGATLVGLGLLPVIQRVVMKVFTALSRKTRDITRISLVRYTRRNVTTVIMFSIAFSFITLVSTVIETQSAQNMGTDENNRGSDICISNSATYLQANSYSPTSGEVLPDENLAHELLAYPGVAKTSCLLATTNELPLIEGNPVSLTLSDLVDYKSSGVQGVAIDQNYVDTVYQHFILFSAGNIHTSFNELFNGSNTVIISESLASTLRLSLNDKCLLDFAWGNGEGSTQKFTIVGVVSNLPGIVGVTSRADMSSGAAVLLSNAIYKEYFQLPVGNYYTYRIFIKLTQQYDNLKDSEALAAQLGHNFGGIYLTTVHDTLEADQTDQQIYAIVNYLFTAILTFAVITSLFGLASNAYSTILERTREVGIIETLGLRKKDVANMFIIEAEIIMVSAAVNGSIIGSIMTFLFYWEISSFSTYPILASYTIPWTIILLELGIAAIVCAICMKLLVKHVENMELMEIFRKTL